MDIFGILVIADRTPADRQNLFDGFGSEHRAMLTVSDCPGFVTGFSACLDNSDRRTGLLV